MLCNFYRYDLKGLHTEKYADYSQSKFACIWIDNFYLLFSSRFFYSEKFQYVRKTFENFLRNRKKSNVISTYRYIVRKYWKF